MSYISLYRKWRPQTFDDMIGQEHIVKTLKNAIEMERITHAYLFTGPRGTGKTSTAKIFAKALNCADGPTIKPCGKCVSCLAVKDGSAMDVIEIDAASNRGIDEIRDLREKVKYLPSQGRYKVYIIDEAHMLTTEASNALLKTLEEPPSHTIFILATTEPNRILGTIISRCQRFDFKRLTVSQLSAHLSNVAEKSEIMIEPAAVSFIARRAEGGVRDALSILEQAASWSDNDVTLASVSSLLGISNHQKVDEFVNGLGEKSVGDVIRIFREVIDDGGEPKQFLYDVIERLRNILVVKECPDVPTLIDSIDEEVPSIRRQADLFSKNDVVKALVRLSAAEQEVRRSANPKLTLELSFVSLCDEDDIGSLLNRIQKIESIIFSGKMSFGEVKQRSDVPGGASRTPVQPAVTKTMSPIGKEDRDAPQIKSNAEIKNTESTAAVDTNHGGKTFPQGSDSHKGQMRISEEQWKEILAVIRANNMPLYAFMEPVVETFVNDGVMRIGFKTGWPVHVKKVSEPKNMAVIAEAASQVLGRKLECNVYVVEEHSTTDITDLPNDSVMTKAVEFFNPIEVKLKE